MCFLRRIFFIVLFACFASSVFAERVEGIRDFFVKMPDEVIPYLNYSLKSDMLDCYTVGNGRKTENLLKGKSWVSYCDSARIDVVLSDGKSLLSVLECERKKGTPIYAVIETIYTPIADSRITFYNSEMELLNGKAIIELPCKGNFFVSLPKSLKGCFDVNEVPEFLKVSVSNDGALLFEADPVWYAAFDSDIRKLIEQNLLPKPLMYEWNGKRFKKV